jgi:hypothetical protein
MRRIIQATMVSGLVFLGSPTLHAVFTVDTFNATQTNRVTGTPSGYKSAFTFSNAVTTAVVGGQRDIFLERTTVGSVDLLTATVNSGILGALSFSTPPGVAGRATIVWDGIDGLVSTNFTGLGSVDLTQGGFNNAFEISRYSDLGASLEFGVYTDESNFSLFTTTVPSGASVFVPALIPFSSFTIGGGSGASFANVGAISLRIDGTANPGTDVVLDYIVAVPEPSSAVLGLLGACGLALSRRRRRS